MTLSDDPESPYSDCIPVPPIMDTQLDQVIIRTLLIPLKKSIQRRLEAMMSKNNRSDWFCTFLCCFVLLHNYELATMHDRHFAIRHNYKVVCTEVSMNLI